MYVSQNAVNQNISRGDASRRLSDKKPDFFPVVFPEERTYMNVFKLVCLS